MNIRLCVCKYRNPIEYVCIMNECTQRRLICKSCAWDHKQHESKVLQINEFEKLITNDVTVQRISDVQNAEGIIHSLDQLIQIAETEIIGALKKRCNDLKDKIKKHQNPFNRTIEHIQNIAKNQYTTATIDSLVKELDFTDIHSQLQKMEATQFQKFGLICKEILTLSDALDKLKKTCQEDYSQELKSIRQYIQTNLDYKEQKQKLQYDQDLFDYIEQKPYYQQQQQQEIRKQQQIIPQHMYLSHMELIKQPRYVQEKASPYNYESQKMKTDHLSSKTLVDYSFFKDDKQDDYLKNIKKQDSQALFRYKEYQQQMLEKREKQESQFSANKLNYQQRQPSQSLYTSLKKQL